MKKIILVLANDWLNVQAFDKSRDKTYFSRRFRSRFRTLMSAAFIVSYILVGRDLEIAFLGVALEIKLKRDYISLNRDLTISCDHSQ